MPIDPSDLLGNCDPPDQVAETFPADPPPCSENTCTFKWSTLDESRGRLAGNVRLRGDEASIETDDDDCGVLRCYTHTDGTNQGIDVALFGNPSISGPVICEDEDGVDLYANPLRKIVDSEGACSLAALPFPTQETSCAEAGACESFFAPGDEGGVFEGCAQTVCATIVNNSCWPMTVTPKVTIRGAELGAAPVTYELQENVAGNFEPKFPVFSSQGVCTLTNAGTGDTSEAGDPAHTHDGPSHDHSLDCGEARSSYSGTTEGLPIELAPGASFTYCVTPSLRYDADVDDAGKVNFGRVIVCLEGRSKITSETIAGFDAGAGGN